MLIANMMPKFALMQNRDEESISPLSFHSNSSSSSNLSYQKRFQENNNRDGESYSNSRYYFNKYNKYDDNGSLPSRIIYKTTGANANNGNNIRFLKKAYNSKYENQESSVGLISNKNILDNSSRVITAADHRNSKKNVDLSADDDKKTEKSDDEKKSTPEDSSSLEKGDEKKVKAKEVKGISEEIDLKNLNDDITNHLDDMFNNMSQMLPEKLTDERESSRFSKWFTVNKEESNDEKAQTAQKNVADGGNMMFPQSVESEKYFQPIDKVESNSLFQLLKGSPEARKDENPLMHMIQNQKQQQNSPNSGQVHSVEELEARLIQQKLSDEPNNRKSDDGEQRVLQNFLQQQLMPNLIQQQQQQHQHQPSSQNQEDVNAFKKLLSQMASEDNKFPNGQNLSQHMIKPFPQHGADLQQQKNFAMAGKVPPKMMNSVGSFNPVAQHMVPQQQFGNNNMDMMKFMQQQQQQKMPFPQIPEVMKRPEVQAIVQGE